MRRSHHGLLPRYKMAWQIVVAAAVGLALLLLANHEPTLYSTRLIFPFFKRLIPDLGWFYVVFAVVVLVGATNEVNLTDGLDGLAISVFAVSAAAFTALAYVSTHVVFSNYLQLVRLNSEAAELTIFCGALVGASLGFLWWNCYPAEIFMGDVGSLGLGGALGTVALLIKQEILFVVVGGVFVMEAASVIIQVGSFKMTGPARVQDGAAASPLRIDWLERAEGHHPVRDSGNHLRVVQSHDVETAMTADLRSPWRQTGHRRRCGAQRYCRRRAARTARRPVTLTDMRPDIEDDERLRDAGVRTRAWRAQSATLLRADLIVTSPGVPYRHPLLEGSARRPACR